MKNLILRIRNKEQLINSERLLLISWIAYVALFLLLYHFGGYSDKGLVAENYVTFLGMFPFVLLMFFQAIMIVIHLHLMGIHLFLAILIGVASFLPHIFGQMAIIPLILLASRIQIRKEAL